MRRQFEGEAGGYPTSSRAFGGLREQRIYTGCAMPVTLDWTKIRNTLQQVADRCGVPTWIASSSALFATNGMHYRVANRHWLAVWVQYLAFGCRRDDDLPVVWLKSGRDLFGSKKEVRNVGPPHGSLQI